MQRSNPGAALALLAVAGIAPAQQSLHVLPAQGNVYMVVGPNSNAAVQVGDEGVLVVDTMPAALSDEFLAAIAKLSDKPVRFIVNTSFLPEYTGGNERSQGWDHHHGRQCGARSGRCRSGRGADWRESVLDTMSASPANSKASLRPAGAWPTDSFVGLRKAIYFNGEPVEVLHIPNSTTDGSSMVWFRRSDVISTGDIFVTDAYPFIDLAHGGNINGVLDGLNRIRDHRASA